MKRLALLTVVAALALSCNKNQVVVRHLASGEWKVTARTINGTPDDPSSYQYERYVFEKCNVNKTACEGLYSVQDPTKGTLSYNFTYVISEKGEKISITMSILGIIVTTNGDILEHSKKKFIWSETDENGDVEITTLEKVN